MSILTKQCKTCNRIFQKPYNCSKKSWEYYSNCSKECNLKSYPNKIIKNCKYCNKEFLVRNYRKNSANYCSKLCTSKGKINHENPVNYSIRRRQIYMDWRKSIMERDNYTCLDCGIKNQKGVGKTIILNVDHIKPLAQIVKENNLKTIEDMLQCDELWNMNNGRTLCYSCHVKTPTYGRSKLYRNTCIASA